MQYSVIIPTMWKSKCLDEMIPLYDKYVDEIIIIDNNPEEKRKLKSDKIKILSKGHNIYVNP